MQSDKTDLRRHLKLASEEIETLRKEAEENKFALADMFTNCTALEMQIILLDYQIQGLNDLLEESENEFSETQQNLQRMRNALNALQETSKSVLEKAKSSSSRVQLAAGIYELASKTKMQEEIQILDEAEQVMARLRDKVIKR